MKREDVLIKIYSGNEVKVSLLKGMLENAGIPASVRNDSGDSYLGGVPAAVDLYIRQQDFSNAEPVLNEFINKNQV